MRVDSEAQDKGTGCRWEGGRVNSLRGKESKSKQVADKVGVRVDSKAQDKGTGCRWEGGRANSLPEREGKSEQVTDTGMEQRTVYNKISDKETY